MVDAAIQVSNSLRARVYAHNAHGHARACVYQICQQDQSAAMNTMGIPEFTEKMLSRVIGTRRILLLNEL